MGECFPVELCGLRVMKQISLQTAAVLPNINKLALVLSTSYPLSMHVCKGQQIYIKHHTVSCQC